MDPTRFDRLLTANAARLSRRHALGIAAGALAAPRRDGVRCTRAQTAAGGAPLGGACTADGDCGPWQGCGIAGPVVCGGSVEDAAGACCVVADGACAADADCCAGHLCFSLLASREGCQAVGTCYFVGEDPDLDAICQAWLANGLAQIPAHIASAVLGGWSPETLTELGLPDACAWPMLAPVTPWCAGDLCREEIPVVHTDDGLGFCYWADPGGYGPTLPPGEDPGTGLVSGPPHWVCRYPSLEPEA